MTFSDRVRGRADGVPGAHQGGSAAAARRQRGQHDDQLRPRGRGVSSSWNTDMQALNNAAPTRLNIGNQVTRGLGAGADRARSQAALEDHQRTRSSSRARTWSSSPRAWAAAPAPARPPSSRSSLAKEGALTVGVVTKPFSSRVASARAAPSTASAQLAEHVDTLITIPNQKLLMLGGDDPPSSTAFRKADEVLYQAVKGISDHHAERASSTSTSPT